MELPSAYRVKYSYSDYVQTNSGHRPNVNPVEYTVAPTVYTSPYRSPGRITAVSACDVPVQGADFLHQDYARVLFVRSSAVDDGISNFREGGREFITLVSQL